MSEVNMDKVEEWRAGEEKFICEIFELEGERYL